MRTFFCLVEIEPGPADNDIMPVRNEILYEFLEIEGTRPAVHKGDIVDRET